MARQLISRRIIVVAVVILVPLLYYYRCILFHKELDNTDIVLMNQSYTGEDKYLGRGVWSHKNPFMYVGVKNICKETSSQYRDFLPKVATSIADTIHEKVTLYFIIYDEKTAYRAHYWAPYELEEEVPEKLLLRQHWEGGKEPKYVHWYIPKLKHLNTEVPDLLHLEDTKVEQVK